jgi:glycosyltransferase involved in cell wall biosynthesis
MATQNIFISFLLPVYNVERFLERCLDTIYNQIEDDCEVILIDDGSTDGSGSICDRYKNKYPSNTYVYHIDNHGAGFARNYALDKARGSYIWFVDSDDKIAFDAIPKIKAVLHHNPSIDIITAGFKRFSNESVGKVENCHPSQILSGEEYLKCGFFNPYLWCNLYRKGFLKKNKIRFCDDLVSQEDWLFNAYAYVAAKHIYLANFQIYFYYQGNPNSTLSRRDKDHLLRGVENTMKAQSELIEFANKFKGTALYRPLLSRLSLTSSGFFYSLYRFHFSIDVIKKAIREYKGIGLYPIGFCDNKKANLFSLFANCKWLFLAICAVRNHLYQINNS